MPTSKKPLILGSTANAERRYYLASAWPIRPVLAQICNIFWKYNISMPA